MGWVQYQSEDGIPYFYNEETGESTWDTPDELKTADEDDGGDWRWIPDEEVGFLVNSDSSH